VDIERESPASETRFVFYKHVIGDQISAIKTCELCSSSAHNASIARIKKQSSFQNLYRYFYALAKNIFFIQTT